MFHDILEHNFVPFYKKREFMSITKCLRTAENASKMNRALVGDFATICLIQRNLMVDDGPLTIRDIIEYVSV